MRRVKRKTTKGSVAKVAKLAVAAPEVVVARTVRTLPEGSTSGKTAHVDFSRMSTEKMHAFWESAVATGSQLLRANQEYVRTAAFQWLRLWATPWRLAYPPLLQAPSPLPKVAAATSPTPTQREPAVPKRGQAGVALVHRRAKANARQPARRKKR